MIGLLVDFDDTRLLARLDALPPELQDKLRPAIERLTAEMLDRVQAAEPYRTGALREATRSFVDQRDNMLRGRVRALAEPGGPAHNVKAGALEYGAHGDVAVRAYERDAGVAVEAYHRDVNVAAYAFLRDAVADVQSEFEAEIERAIADLAKDFA